MNPRYLAYCKAHGNTPEAQHAADGAAWPGGIMCGFILWIGERWRAFEAHKGARLTSLSRDYWRAEHAAEFDAWIMG